MEKSDSYWKSRETVTALAIRIEIVQGCEFKEGEIQQRCIDLYYHAMKCYELKKHIQAELTKGNHMWDTLVEDLLRMQRNRKLLITLR